jgi:hypothetical protein
MLRLFTITIAVLIAVVAVTAVAIVLARVIRHVRHRKQAALAAEPRRKLLAFVADNGESGGAELVAIPDDAWRAAEGGALSLLGKLRGEAHLALVSVFLAGGTARAALRDVRSRSRVRRARAAQVLGDLELRQAVPDLCGLLTDRYAEVRIVAVRALGRIGDPAAAWRLIASLDQAEPVPSLLATHTLVSSARTRRSRSPPPWTTPRHGYGRCAWTPSACSGPPARAPRWPGPARDSYLSRVAAAANLGEAGHPRALEPLTGRRPARPAALRAAAARALGDLGAPPRCRSWRAARRRRVPGRPRGRARACAGSAAAPGAGRRVEPSGDTGARPAVWSAATPRGARAGPVAPTAWGRA